MSGMTAMGASSSSNYDSRTVEIEVSGLRRQDISRTSNYKIKIPHSSMVATIQNITRMGGKIDKVTVTPLFATNSEESESNE